MDPHAQFREEQKARAAAFARDCEFQTLSRQWVEASMGRQYVYNFDWLGRPIIQLPQDMVAVQELVWTVRPDLIIETGIAHGGSLVLSASLLALLDLADAVERKATLDPRASQRRVVGIDIDIRSHNRTAIEAHPLAGFIEMIEGSSTAPDIIARVKKIAAGYPRVLVFLDSMHTHMHVLAELEAYAPLATIGSYCVVFDTFVEDMPHNFFSDRPWNVGNSPRTAVREYLTKHPEFEVDTAMASKLMITAAPGGFLRRVA
jgi:cephalosporin hydroxylase